MERYFSTKDEYLYSSAIIQFVLTGFMDRKLHLENIFKEVGPHPNKDTVDVLLSAYWDLNDSEFASAVGEVLRRIDNGQYRMIDYPHIFATFTYFTRKGLTGMDLPNLKRRFVEGLDQAVKGAEYHDDMLMNIRDNMNEQGLLEDERLAYQEVKTKLTQLNQSLKEQRLVNVATNLELLMENDFSAFCSQLCDLDFETAQECVLKQLGVSLIQQRLVQASNRELLVFASCLKERYKFSSIRQRLEPERETLAQLHANLSTYVAGQSAKLSVSLLIDISEVCKSVLQDWNV